MTFSSGQILTADDLNDVLGDWTTWSPTYTALTIGNGTAVARYKQVGKLVVAQWSLTMGSTSSVSTGPAVSLPVAPTSTYVFGSALGAAYFQDASAGAAGRAPGTAAFWNTAGGSAFLTADQAAGQTLSATVPFTWATSDVMSFTVTYEAA